MKVHELKVSIDARFTEVDARFTQIDKRFEALDKRISDEASEVRCHFDVAAEDIKSQVKTLAESIAASNARCDQRFAKVASENVTLLSALSDHELRLRVLEGASGRHSDC